MPKLKREQLAHYVDTGWNSKVSDVGKAAWEIVGSDIEEMNVDLSPDTEQFKNILGQSRVKHNGYEATMSADPFYADPDSKLYGQLRDIAMERKKGDDCKTLMMEVLVEDTSATKHRAYVREVMVIPQSYGGDTEGVSFPFDVTEDGAFVAGTVSATSLATGAPEFTAGDTVTASLSD